MRNERAKRLKRARIATGYTQRAAAKKLNKSLHTYSAWEQARAEPSTIDDILKTCALFNITLNWWLLGKQPETTDPLDKLPPETQQAIKHLIEQLSK